MGNHLKVLLLALVMVLATAFPAEAATSFGSVQVRSSADVIAGGSAQFRMLLFNAHDSGDLYVTISETLPPGWTTSIEPREFVLPYRAVGDTMPEEGYEFLSTSLGDVKTKPVTITVSIPGGEETGSYTVRVSISAKNRFSGISMSQVRSYGFTVNVKGREPVTPENESVPPVQAQEVGNVSVPVQPAVAENWSVSEHGQPGDLVGMIISNPVIAPAALSVACIMFVLLRLLKKI
jgi:uncharacterized membrane protein